MMKHEFLARERMRRGQREWEKSIARILTCRWVQEMSSRSPWQKRKLTSFINHPCCSVFRFFRILKFFFGSLRVLLRKIVAKTIVPFSFQSSPASRLFISTFFLDTVSFSAIQLQYALSFTCPCAENKEHSNSINCRQCSSTEMADPCSISSTCLWQRLTIY